MRRPSAQLSLAWLDAAARAAGATATARGTDARSGTSSAAVPINATVLRREIALRGLTDEAFARAAGISPTTLSRALHGHRVTSRTLRRLASALLRVPTIAGAAELMGADGTTSARADTPQPLRAR